MRARMSRTSAAVLARSRGVDEHVADGLLDRRPQRRRAGDDARAGQRHVLPGPGLAGLVVDEARELRGHRALLAGGTQAHVDLVEDAFRGRRGEGADQALGQARIVLRDGRAA